MKACAGSNALRCEKSLLLIVIGLLVGSGLLQPSIASAAEPLVASDSVREPNEVRGLLVFRVSDAFLRSGLEREIRQSSPVDRVIEGTRSCGTADTVAQMAVVLRPQEEGIAFQIVGRGLVNTNTIGRNGPAILRANLRTSFTAQIPILFDGIEFSRGDLSLITNSRLRISSVGTDVPRLRGRLVTRIASRRAAESLPRVEAISTYLTERELEQAIAESVDESIEKLNRRLQTRQLVAFFMRAANGRWLRYSSSKDALRVAWYPLLNSTDVPRCPLELGGDAAVQLWIHDKLAGALGIDELPRIAEDFEKWLQVFFPNATTMKNVPLPSVLPLPPMSLDRVEDWYVVEFEPA